ncbi:MAG: DUF4410 domain-containing protein [Candidatus Sumerlaeaceae bacterium]|nr:DUF4410 domain-containing protein [Candidatus Sumerlaeaceae bacterium]
MWRNFLKLVAALAAAVVCASPATAAKAHKTGWLQDYHRLGHIGGVPLEQVWLHPEFDIREYRSLYIAPVEIDCVAYRRHPDIDRGNAQRLGAAIRAHLEQQLKGAGIFAFVSTDPYFMTARHQALTLQLRLTEMNSGNPDARALIGFGAGATEVQLEGKLYDNKTKRTFVEFADRRLHPGSSLLFGRSATCDSEYLMGVDLKGIMRGVVKLFIYMREEGPLREQ